MLPEPFPQGEGHMLKRWEPEGRAGQKPRTQEPEVQGRTQVKEMEARGARAEQKLKPVLQIRESWVRRQG